MVGLQKLGFIDPSPHPLLHPHGPDITWREFMCSVVGKPQDIIVENLKDALLDRLGGKMENLQVGRYTLHIAENHHPSVPFVLLLRT